VLPFGSKSRSKILFVGERKRLANAKDHVHEMTDHLIQI